MEAKAILFHSNTHSKCEHFIKYKDFLILSANVRDDKWLGKGMYFWDNYGNAHWWNITQKRRNPNEEYRIVTVNVRLDKMLDLTDYEIYKKIEELWQKICKKTRRDPDIPLGDKLNYLFTEEKYELFYHVIKVYGKYNTTPSDGVFKFNYLTKEAEPTMAVKCIYSVRNSDCIIEKEYVN